MDDLKLRLCSTHILKLLQYNVEIGSINWVWLINVRSTANWFVKMTARLTSHRLSHQRSIFRLEISADGLGADVPLSYVGTILDLLNDYWSKFQAVQLTIEEKLSNKDVESEIEIMESTEASYLRTKNKLTAMADLMKVKDEPNGEVGANVASHVKLPKLEVPTFDGSFNNWSSFRDMFLSMVGNKDTISDGEKLQYLKPNLSGEAADIVAEYKITDENYKDAWAALEHEYENKRLLVKSHMDTLFNQTVMEDESAEALRLLLRTTQRCLQALKTLGGPIDSWDWLLVQLVGTRLDTKTRRYWELTHKSKEMPTWQQMVAALEIRCNALESEQDKL